MSLVNIFNYNFYVLFLSFSPLILIGIIEDLTQKTSVRIRFFSSLLSSFLIITLSNKSLGNVDIEWMNTILSYKFLSIFISVLGITITCNAWNFIDGVNGLASGLTVTTLFAFILLIPSENLFDTKFLLTQVIFASLAFMILNISTGKIFLGDTGSYFLGSFVAWQGISITFDIQQISPWVIFLIIIYPATEIIFSTFRRILFLKSPFKADNMHLHSLFYLFISKKFSYRSNNFCNSFTGIITLTFASMPSLAAIYFKNEFQKIIMCIIIFISIYTFFYFLLYIEKIKLNN